MWLMQCLFPLQTAKEQANIPLKTHLNEQRGSARCAAGAAEPLHTIMCLKMLNVSYCFKVLTK